MAGWGGAGFVEDRGVVLLPDPCPAAGTGLRPDISDGGEGGGLSNLGPRCAQNATEAAGSVGPRWVSGARTSRSEANLRRGPWGLAVLEGIPYGKGAPGISEEKLSYC